MFEACGVFSLNMFYVFIDVDCFVVNLMNVWFANGWCFGALKFSVPRTISGTGHLPGVKSRSHSPKGI